MSSVELGKLDAATKNQLIVSYATLILSSSKHPVTEENLNKVIEASGNKADGQLVQAYAKILQGKDVSKFYACGGGAAPAGGHHEAAKAEKKEEPKKVEKKEEKVEEKVEEDFGGIGDMFG